ncbi:MAG TPA: hypothetical protein VHD90_26180 [Phototrophicaceae bacterium]|nr:hypothetical protein [Phototrophicaceae bacterium]
MNVDIHWENEAKTVVRINCSGLWNWQDMAAATTRWMETDGQGSNSGVLLDLRGVIMPIDVVLHLKIATRDVHRVNGLIVVLASDAATTLVFKLFVSLYKAIGGKFRLVTSEAEAHAELGLTP